MIDYHNFSGKKYINNLVQNHILNNIYFQQPVLQNQHQTLIIEEFEPDVFRQLIEYIHTGCVTLQPRTLLGLSVRGLWEVFGRSLRSFGGFWEIFWRFLGDLLVFFWIEYIHTGCVTLQPRTLLGLYLEGIWDNFGKSLGGLWEVFGRSLGGLWVVIRWSSDSLSSLVFGKSLGGL